MNRLLVAVAILGLTVAAVSCTENDNGTADAGPTTDGGVTDGGVTDGGTDGGVTGTATVTGTIPGLTSFTAQDAITTVDPDNANGAIVLITDEANACAAAQANTLTKGAQVLGLQFRNQTTGQTQPLAAGTYNVTTSTAAQDGMNVIAVALIADQTCNFQPANAATGGTVTLTNAAGNKLEGSFSLDFPGSGPVTTVTGTFTAPFCDESNAPANTTCK